MLPLTVEITPMKVFVKTAVLLVILVGANAISLKQVNGVNTCCDVNVL